ncbi:NADH-quinone oxidoreductase subunit NuoK [Thermovibrio ammonificans]|jgi:NADH-quinone oxidoreductase subunit K|uniref:NADH-quinone oxidoreductase subunit K n=1 Tax=Thermovibrio ammonificans (strain DSM 15698 / JCM 12110 / HB-1) TaxID=648996 RepID=E8T6C5_THEA1|nr:NADH-quinone oxidoreductase subunit NuoK [Thermovibrio ammonificans]ADU96709.1 NADH-ubiquinone oxidoreductase chain 4L [Thermovibrio ammonificans HB-1]
MSPFGLFLVSALLFGIGMFGVIVRRNVISLFFSLELLLNSVNVLLVGFSKLHGNLFGEIFVFFVLAVAAAEAAVGLAIVVALYRLRKSTNTEDFSLLRW